MTAYNSLPPVSCASTVSSKSLQTPTLCQRRILAILALRAAPVPAFCAAFDALPPRFASETGFVCNPVSISKQAISFKGQVKLILDILYGTTVLSTDNEN